MKFAGLWNVLAIRFSSLLESSLRLRGDDSSPLADRRTRRRRRRRRRKSVSLSLSLSLSAVSSISVPFRLFSEWQARNRDDGCSLYFSSEFSPLSTCFCTELHGLSYRLGPSFYALSGGNIDLRRGRGSNFWNILGVAFLGVVRLINRGFFPSSNRISLDFSINLCAIVNSGI